MLNFRKIDKNKCSLSQSTVCFKISPDQCLNIDYTIFYENENNFICDSHSNFTAKREKIEHTGWFEMHCVGK